MRILSSMDFPPFSEAPERGMDRRVVFKAEGDEIIVLDIRRGRDIYRIMAESRAKG